jgi:hypothetical protein
MQKGLFFARNKFLIIFVIFKLSEKTNFINIVNGLFIWLKRTGK